MTKKASIDRTQPPQSAVVVVPAIGNVEPWGNTRVQETTGLVEALGVDLQTVQTFKVKEPNAARLFGSGQLDAIEELLSLGKANLLIVDCSLTPIQQRNLENSLRVKVMDRTGLILEIFGLRARSAEGRLQVEMARQLYERSRLVRTWTHLERQRGGTGFLAGPGESQLEADRRMLDRRIGKLKTDLDSVRRTRQLQRSGRKKRGNPVVALVGYTNAGKSTLFNSLTQADVFAADMLFATLDPTARDVKLESGRTITLIDTVGFITDLPTHLIESFKATIEEAVEADLLIHVRDISDSETERQSEDVETVLTQIEKETRVTRPETIEVWNKIDALSDEDLASLKTNSHARPDVALVSAIEEQGIANLLTMIEQRAFPPTRLFTMRLGPEMGKPRAWLHNHCQIDSEKVQTDGDIIIDVLLSVIDLDKFVKEHSEHDLEGAILSSRSIS